MLLRDVGQVKEGTMPGEIDRYNMRRVVSMTGNIQGNDLGDVARQVAKAVEAAGQAAGRGTGGRPRAGRAD